MVGDHNEEWMRFALSLAQSAQGQTSPNPMVGAVAVKEGRLIGFGAHLRAGTPHAEVHALDMAGEQAKGCTLYVTLEPCNHYGRTPPCTKKIIDSGVKRVVVGCLDPDHRVAGQGLIRLREAGVEIIEGVLNTDCLQLNEAYFHHRKTGLPFVTLKTAVTLDGKTATVSGDSRWITGDAARLEVHRLRHTHDAVLVGSGTVLADRPQLTTRLPGGGVNPIRVVIDSRLQLSLDTPVADVSEVPTWVFCTEEADEKREQALIERGLRVFRTGGSPRVDLHKVFQRLGQEEIMSVLTECGGELNATLLQGGHVNQVKVFLAPKLLGGKESETALEGENPLKMADAMRLTDVEVAHFGEDICITGKPDHGAKGVNC
ncbi:diaminohydroxyphosphoribosylaminopyrimidine deaminase / 5-amino-6-(5-phosphoribosylamino)uracil reductase [Marininema mesophilum]|uniref:Riboflavin biosynthesis protein RibD n=1 Tax=Marininema mesophilum TaxID=1048340 RepID=A0A1H2UJ75_9BACL|nr:bifunctional diaminohydroxyphosphoribosylaminopyrimidine deaminase/5-amino-6-(5-phosphoribosylamino)uracil reductase RibD [Marininema mesophilum]SDW56141.1 diaminohydroxyphosphoribosylaminopyrimidine deaminase / 5-amino-6-(5-phosphoribosylamino)uracil reductase [Marininema mesophilum]